MKRLLIVVMSFVLCLGVTSSGWADSIKGRIGIGLGYPYLSLKYGLTPKISLEARGAFGSGINVYGGRLYYNFNPKDRTVIFIGGEGDYVSFNTDKVSGDGYIGYGFVGGEYFITKKITLNLDTGAAYIGLKEKKFDLDASGIEWVANIGISFYLGGKR